MIFMPFFRQKSVQLDSSLLLSLLPCAPLDQAFTTAVCGGRVPYRYRTVYDIPPFSTQHTPSFCVSPSSCQHFSRLENESRPCNGTAEAATFFTRRQLLSLNQGAKPCRLNPVIHSRLKDLGIARNLLRKRSKGGGRRKQRRIPVLITSRDGCLFVPSGQRLASLPIFSATARWIALQRLPFQRVAVLFSRKAWKHFHLRQPSMLHPPTVLPAEGLGNATARQVPIFQTLT